jgi:putative ABC transport system permease protein
MGILRMAVRNIGRNKRRSLLAALSVFIAIFAVVFADGFVTGILSSMVKNITKNQTGHVNIETERYRSRERFMPASEAMPDARSVIGTIESMSALKGEVALVEARAQFGVVLSSESGTKAALGIGGDPEKERKLLMLDKAILPGGAYLSGRGEAIVGRKLAADLALGVGDALKVVAQKADYGLGFKKFRIVGLFDTNMESFDGSTFQVGIEDARDLLGLGAGATQVIVMLSDYRKSEEAAAAIGAALSGTGGLSVRSWSSISDLASIIKMSEGMFMILEAFIAFLGSFIIANIMMMVVLERRREIGIMKSMGMERPRLLGLFLAEGTLLGAIGSAAGVLAGTVLTLALGAKGVDLSGVSGGVDYQMDSVIYPAAQPGRIAAMLAMGILVSAIIAYLPSRSAARMDPIEAIRSV